MTAFDDEKVASWLEASRRLDRRLGYRAAMLTAVAGVLAFAVRAIGHRAFTVFGHRVENVGIGVGVVCLTALVAAATIMLDLRRHRRDRTEVLQVLSTRPLRSTRFTAVELGAGGGPEGQYQHVLLVDDGTPYGHLYQLRRQDPVNFQSLGAFHEIEVAGDPPGPVVIRYPMSGDLALADTPPPRRAERIRAQGGYPPRPAA